MARRGSHPDDARFERSARFWMRAYPRRWRVARGEEVIGVLLDLAAPGARRVGAGTALDLLRGGLATRWREHPPPWTWITYRFDKRIPRQYRGWAADDIDGRFYFLRQGSLIAFIPAAYSSWQSYSRPDFAFIAWWFYPALMAAIVVLGVTVDPFVGPKRRAARRIHLAADAGEPLGPGVYVARPEPRPRIRADRATPRAVLGFGFAAVVSTVGAFLAPTMIGAIPVDGEPYPQTSEIVAASYPGMALGVSLVLLAALALGFVLGWRSARRLPRMLAARPAQPDRLLVRSHRTVDVWTAIGLLAVVGDAWLEATGRLVLSLSVIVAAVGWAMLPRMIVLARYRDAVPGLAELSWSDLLCAVGGATPPVDLPLAVVEPYDGPPVPGAVVEVWPWRRGPAEPPWPQVPA